MTTDNDIEVVTELARALIAALDERDARVPLTYDELSNLIQVLQDEMERSKDTDFQALIDKLRQYHQR